MDFKSEQLIDIELGRAMVSQAIEKAGSKDAFCEQNNINQQQLTSILNGSRGVGKKIPDFLSKISQACSVPLVEVLHKFGILRTVDFIHSGDLNEELNRLYTVAKRDSLNNRYLPTPSQWEKLEEDPGRLTDEDTQDLRLKLILMYQDIARINLIQLANIEDDGWSKAVKSNR